MQGPGWTEIQNIFSSKLRKGPTLLAEDFFSEGLRWPKHKRDSPETPLPVLLPHEPCEPPSKGDWDVRGLLVS